MPQEEKEEINVSDYPQGWEKCLELLEGIPEESRESFLIGWMMMVLNF
ncbi:MAG: hypothetical protein FWG30_11350 [Eubacteriaceae bacterium]|nr:hypothetical protein [Eubacteriaceae bacterium]